MSLYQSKEWQKAQKGQLYLAFVPELVAARARTNDACNRFNSTSDTSRRNMVNLWRKITQDSRPLPIIDLQKSAEEDERLFDDEPWIMAPIHADYGVNIQIGTGVFLNYNSTFVDTCPITIGARTLIGPNCSFYSGTHPVDPALRNGTAGPETGKPITIGEDSWIGGNVIVLPGVSIGKGCTIGAGSVVTRDIPPFHVAAGNPARVLRRIETAMDPTTTVDQVPGAKVEADGPEATIAKDALDAQKN